MCIIIDANVFGIFLNEANQDMQPVRKWLNDRGKLAYSPTKKFQKELKLAPKMKNWLSTYQQRGRVKQISKEKVEEKRVNLAGLKSDDPHIIALAQAANIKLLVSKDINLHKDFTNSKFISGGKVYQNKGHKHLLSFVQCP